MKFFNSSALAKVAAWLGGLLGAGAAGKAFGKYDGLAAALGLLLTAFGVHNASNTSNGATK